MAGFLWSLDFKTLANFQPQGFASKRGKTEILMMVKPSTSRRAPPSIEVKN